MMQLQFHKSDKIVVYFNVTLIVPVDRPALSNLDALYQPQKRRAVQFLQLGVVSDEGQPVISGLFIFMTGFQLGASFVRCSRFSVRSSSYRFIS